MFFLYIIAWGMAIGWIAQLILGKARKAKDRNWGQALAAGALGSLVGGTLGSMLMGEGFSLKLGGVVASVIGAIIVVIAWDMIASRGK